MSKSKVEYAPREQTLVREPCGTVEFWYCEVCNESKVVTTGMPASWDLVTHQMLHKVKVQKFPSAFGPRLVWDRDRVGG